MAFHNLRLAVADDRSGGGVSGKNFVQIGGIEVKYNDRQIMFTAERKSGAVHDFQLFLQCFAVVQFIVAHGIRELFRIGGVNAVDLGRFEYGIAGSFQSPECAGSVGGEKGITGAACENDQFAALKSGNRVVFFIDGDEAIHRDRALEQNFNSQRVEYIFQHQCVHRGCEHAHFVGIDPVHHASGTSAAPDVAGADDNGDLHAAIDDRFDPGGNFPAAFRVITVIEISFESFAAEFQQYPGVYRFSHDDFFLIFGKVVMSFSKYKPLFVKSP